MYQKPIKNPRSTNMTHVFFPSASQPVSALPSCWHTADQTTGEYIRPLESISFNEVSYSTVSLIKTITASAETEYGPLTALPPRNPSAPQFKSHIALGTPQKQASPQRHHNNSSSNSNSILLCEGAIAARPGEGERECVRSRSR